MAIREEVGKRKEEGRWEEKRREKKGRERGGGREGACVALQPRTVGRVCNLQALHRRATEGAYVDSAQH